MASLHEILVEAARGAGFPLAGGVDIDRVPLEGPVAKYDEWLKSGYAGAMEYLVRGRDRRADPRAVFPGAKSVFCVAWPYSSKPAGETDPSRGPRYARYLRSADYHKDAAAKLERMMASASARAGRELKWKVCVDTSAVLERSWAVWAGLGWIGKNSMLIHPQLGSYLFLGEVLIDQELGQEPRPLPNYCGSCTRCLEACPTRAIPKPGTIDSNRCIAYMTLEKRGELPADEGLKRGIGTWIAGCDVCQEVCPFNTKAARAPLEAEDKAISLKEWEALLRESEADYKLRVKDSSLSRVKPGQFSRNVAITLANAISGSESHQFENLIPLIRARATSETDTSAQLEWARCLRILESE